jgi:hypothetical protein
MFPAQSSSGRATLSWQTLFNPEDLKAAFAYVELYAAPRSGTEKAHPKLTYFNRLPKGGHFAAWE